MSGRILIFDSGVGGLSIYQKVIQQQPQLAVDYLFDNAYFPYGELPEALLIERLCALIEQQIKMSPVQLIIIACNSASTVALPALRERLNIPVVGVVPAIKPAAELTQRKVIGLLATQGTVQRQYTTELANEFAGDCQLISVGSNQLVALAEAKLKGWPVDLESLRKICSPFIKGAMTPDVIILGCTHFPLLADELKSVLPQETVLVDSGEAIARRVQQLLKNKKPQQVGLNYAYYTKALNDDALIVSLRDHGFSHFKLLTA